MGNVKSVLILLILTQQERLANMMNVPQAKFKPFQVSAKDVGSFSFQTKKERLASLKRAGIDKSRRRVANALSAGITHIQMIIDSNALLTPVIQHFCNSLK